MQLYDDSGGSIITDLWMQIFLIIHIYSFNVNYNGEYSDKRTMKVLQTCHQFLGILLRGYVHAGILIYKISTINLYSARCTDFTDVKRWRKLDVWRCLLSHRLERWTMTSTKTATSMKWQRRPTSMPTRMASQYLFLQGIVDVLASRRNNWNLAQLRLSFHLICYSTCCTRLGSAITHYIS